MRRLVGLVYGAFYCFRERVFFWVYGTALRVLKRLSNNDDIHDYIHNE
jgi:hypothetical protein